MHEILSRSITDKIFLILTTFYQVAVLLKNNPMVVHEQYNSLLFLQADFFPGSTKFPLISSTEWTCSSLSIHRPHRVTNEAGNHRLGLFFCLLVHFTEFSRNPVKLCRFPAAFIYRLHILQKSWLTAYSTLYSLSLDRYFRYI